MKLTHIYNKIALFAVAALTFTACDNVDEDDRYIYVEPIPISKCVLVEDFTGQFCVQCPNGTAVLEQLMEQYSPDTVIVVGMHSGAQSSGMFGHTPLWTEGAEYYFSQWPISGQPTAVVDRRRMSENYSTDWSNFVRDALQQTAPLELHAATSYDEASRTVTVDITADGVLDVSGKLQLWLVEDNLVSYQVTPPSGVYDYSYVHNHVFRSAINGLTGDDFTLAWDEQKTLTYTADLNELENAYIASHESEGSEYVRWKPEDMYVVAFVYNSGGVQQAVRVPVISSDSGETGGGEAE